MSRRKFLTATFVGTALGAVAGLLLAPRTGLQTRQAMGGWLSRVTGRQRAPQGAAARLRATAAGWGTTVRETAGELGARGNRTAGAALDRGRSAWAHGAQRLREAYEKGKSTMEEKRRERLDGGA